MLYFLERPPPLTWHLGQAYSLLPASAQQMVSPVRVSGECFMFTQSHMNYSNFGVDENGRTVLIGFSEVGLLPETFIAHTLSSDQKPHPITASLGLSGNSNLGSMAVIAVSGSGIQPETRYVNLCLTWKYLVQLTLTKGMAPVAKKI